MIPETAEFKEKATNQEQEKVHKDRGRTEGWEGLVALLGN